jgi:hypothetical protein
LNVLLAFPVAKISMVEIFDSYLIAESATTKRKYLIHISWENIPIATPVGLIQSTQE